MTTSTNTRRFNFPWLSVVSQLALITLLCVNLGQCSTSNTKTSHLQHHFNRNIQSDDELLGELRELLVEEGRTFSISNISLVITYVTFIVGLTMLAGFIWLAFSTQGSSGGYGSYNRRSDFSGGLGNWLFSLNNFFDSDGEYKRHKRSNSFEFRDQAMASKLHMLDESFRKFEMDDLGCQMLLSCEAAQLETLDHPIYGNLTSKVHKLLSRAKSSRESKSGTRVHKLLQAHREGRKHGSSCKKLYGDLCHSIMEKIEKAEKEDIAKEAAIQSAEQDKATEKHWEKKSKMAKFDMDKKMLMKKKKYRMKY